MVQTFMILVIVLRRMVYLGVGDCLQSDGARAKSNKLSAVITWLVKSLTHAPRAFVVR